MKNNLSILLIAHNEETNIARTIKGLIESYDKGILEIIVVDEVYSAVKSLF